jgi:hypothetical protein
MRAVWPYWPIIQEQSRLSPIFAAAEKHNGHMDLPLSAAAPAEFHVDRRGMDITPSAVRIVGNRIAAPAKIAACFITVA